MRRLNVLIRQFDAAGRCIETREWICDPFALHVLAFDIRLSGCARMEIAEI